MSKDKTNTKDHHKMNQNKEIGPNYKQNEYADHDLRDIGSRNSRMSKTMPKDGNIHERERPLKDPLASGEDTKDEAIQMTPTMNNEAKPDTAGTKDIGVQFTFEDQDSAQSREGSVEERNDAIFLRDEADSNSIIENTAQKTSPKELVKQKEEPKSPLNIFENEQGTGEYKAISDTDEKIDESEKTIDADPKSPFTSKLPSSFDSRKTSQSKAVHLPKEDSFVTDKNAIKGSNADPKINPTKGVANSENTETKDDEKDIMESSRSDRVTNRLTDRNTARFMDSDNLALFTLKDWKDSQIFEWYSMATKSQRVSFIKH